MMGTVGWCWKLGLGGVGSFAMIYLVLSRIRSLFFLGL